jgi:hypothetical protein
MAMLAPDANPSATRICCNALIGLICVKEQDNVEIEPAIGAFPSEPGGALIVTRGQSFFLE